MGRGAIVIGAWEELVKQTACEVMGNKLIACDREVQRWEEGVWTVSYTHLTLPTTPYV